MASSSSDFPHNNYATKKTITEGLLDIALLTANATQMKLLLEVGEDYPYYVLLLTLLSVSILLQVVRGCINVVLGSLYNINEDSDQKKSILLNNVVLILGVFSSVVNVIISSFNMSESIIK